MAALIGVSSIDGCGKGYLTDKIVAQLQLQGQKTVGINVDGGLNLPQTKLHQLADLGQAIWYDYIRRSFIASGELKALLDQGVRGVTSHPTIFEKAIAGSSDYDEDLHRLVDQGKPVEEIYEALA